MAAATGSFAQLERQRENLEKNIEKLSSLLNEWQQWKLEYETLKKEMNSLPQDSPPELIKATREQFKGVLVDEEETAKFFGSNSGYDKSRDQIISTLVNRIDYVTRNIATLQRQVDAAKNARDQAQDTHESDTSGDEDVPEEADFAEDEGGLPVTEILEELDDDDNVVSYSLRTPGNSQPQLLEALEKAGLKEVPSSPRTVPEKGKEVVRPPAIQSPAPQGNSAETKGKKKSVRFTETTKQDIIPAEEEPKYMTLSADKIDALMREAKEQESMISDPQVPDDESDDEAQLRRDMLQYNLSELNPVVAELTLEEGGATDEDDYDWDYDDDDDEDEDQWGRSKSSAMNEDYRQKMLEIQQRLQNHNFGSSANRGDGANDDDDDDDDDDDEGDAQEGIAKIRVKTEELRSPSILKDKSEPSEAKKAVRFASALDVAEKPTPVQAVTPSIGPQRPEVDPLSDVIERKSGGTQPSTAPVPKKASRFKMARGDGPPSQAPGFRAPVSSDGLIIAPEQPLSEQQFAPSGPEGQTIATSVLERPSSDKPREPDEFDADMLKQQAAVEYHKVRNRMIQKQGGFMKEDESPIQPLDEEEGGPKRLSRFKAARLAKS